MRKATSSRVNVKAILADPAQRAELVKMVTDFICKIERIRE